ncbi:hypothetical protein ACWCO0_09405 [Streptomyces tubercidicus]
MTYTVTYAGGRTEVCPAPSHGTFGTLRRLRREDREKRARDARESRLVELQRNIKALEQWHHAWRLERDLDYRALHPGEWCDGHSQPRSQCRSYYYGCYSAAARRAIRRQLAAREAPPLTPEARRAATLRIAEWGRQA